MANAINSLKHMTMPLTSYLNRGIEFAKVRAQEKNLRISDRQRIGRDGCVQAILAQFLTLSEDDQDKWVENGIKVLLENN